MDLDEFVRESILQITSGLREANEALLTKNGKQPADRRYVFLKPGSDKERGTGLEFDVAVTTRSEMKGNAGAKVRLAVVDAEIGGGGGSSKEAVSRIKFVVSVDQWLG